MHLRLALTAPLSAAATLLGMNGTKAVALTLPRGVRGVGAIGEGISGCGRPC